MKKKLLGYYDYTVILTYCGMLFAVTGIFLALGAKYIEAIICLMLAGGCDMFDGAVAATKQRTPAEKRFGIQIDSLSDLISFGVLPGVFVYCIMERLAVAGIISAIYILCALIRLAYFNVLEEERQKETDESRMEYLGIPVTAVALLLPAITILSFDGIINATWLFPALLVLLAIGFVAPLSVKKPHAIGKTVLVIIGLSELIGIILLLKSGVL